MNVQRMAAVCVCLCLASGARISAQGAAPAFAVAEAVQAPAPAPAGTGPRSTARLTGLSVVLVTGDSEDGSASGRPSGTPLEIPAAARKALASISSFLPYKSYSMADAALVSTTANSSCWRRWMCITDAPASKAAFASFAISSGVTGT